MTTSDAIHVCAVVVTYNRSRLLRRCLDAISRQPLPFAGVTVVDNASTDGTDEWLREWLPAHLPQASVLTLPENTGGAGGFAAGLRRAVADGADWVWMMDDDACPHPTALAELLAVARDPANVYGSLAVNGERTAWATTLLDPRRVTHLAADVPSTARVESLPLLGLLIHRDLVAKIGYPDAGFFIAADDVEYCLRARRAGADIIVAGNSRIEHPLSQQRTLRVLGVDIAYLSLPPWKRYYDTRNRLLIARKYYGMKLWTQAIPGSFVRLVAALRKEPRKLAQTHAFFAGLIDGLLGIKGKRHEKWGISM